jgi:hypothetical protein
MRPRTNEFKQATKVATLHHAGTQLAKTAAGTKSSAVSYAAGPHVKLAIETAKAAAEGSKKLKPIVARVAQPHESAEHLSEKVNAHAEVLAKQRAANPAQGSSMANAHMQVAKAAGIPRPAKMGVTRG